MHTKDLARAGTSVRVSLVAARRESTVFPTPSTPPGMSLTALVNATNRLAVIAGPPGGNHPARPVRKPEFPCVEGTS